MSEKICVGDQLAFATDEVDGLVEEQVEGAVAVRLRGEHLGGLQVFLREIGLGDVGGLVALDQIEVEHQLKVLFVIRILVLGL